MRRRVGWPCRLALGIVGLLLLAGAASLHGFTKDRCRYCTLDRIRRASSERNPWGLLKAIFIRQVDYRGSDRDIVRLHEPWFWDTSDLYSPTEIIGSPFNPSSAPANDRWVVCPES